VRAFFFEKDFDLSILHENESVVWSAKNKLAIIRDKDGKDIASVKLGHWLVRDIHDIVIVPANDFDSLYRAMEEK
jgi:hypothetical protein